MTFPASGGAQEPAQASPSRDIPGVIFPPPLIALAGVLLGVGLQLIYPAPFLPETAEAWVGVMLIGAGLALWTWAFRELTRHGTSIETRKATTALVTTGPYRFSRNPVYVSGVLILLGIAGWVNSLWLLATTALTIVIIRYGVIAREEQYLERKFGPAYVLYKSMVRRWV